MSTPIDPVRLALRLEEAEASLAELMVRHDALVAALAEQGFEPPPLDAEPERLTMKECFVLGAIVGGISGVLG